MAIGAKTTAGDTLAGNVVSVPADTILLMALSILRKEFRSARLESLTRQVMISC